MDAGTQELREQPAEQRDPRTLASEAAAGRKLNPKEQHDALAWLLSDSPEDAPQAERTVRVNVGTDDAPVEIEWTLRAIDGDELRRIQAKVNNPRALQRGGGQVDEFEIHARVVVAASVYPDVREAARQLAAARGHAVPDTAKFLRERFAHKPGLIPQLAGIVMQLSGFDDTHVTEVESGKP